MQEAAAKALARDRKSKKPKTDPQEAPKPNAEAKRAPKAKATNENEEEQKPAGGKNKKAPDAKKAADLKKAFEASQMILDLSLNDCKPAAADLPGFSWSEFKQVSFTCNCVIFA